MKIMGKGGKFENKKMCIKYFYWRSFFSLILIGGGDTKPAGQKTMEKEKETIIEQIKKRKKIIVGTEASYPPFSFVEDGKIVGYEIEASREIAKSLGVKIEFIDIPFAGILSGLEAEKFDFIVAGVSATPERRGKYSMTVPLCEDSMGVLKLKNNEAIKSLEDLSGKKVAVLVNSLSIDSVKDYEKRLKDSGKEGLLEIKFYPNLPEAHMDLKNGRVDAVVQGLPSLKILDKDQPGTYEIIGVVGKSTYIVWATRKNDDDLRKFIDVEILKMKKSGKLTELQEKWFGATFDLPDQLPE